MSFATFLAPALIALVPVCAAPPSDVKADAEFFRGRTVAEFRQLDASKQTIDPQNFREPLLSAAIFHEANRRRAEMKIPALAFEERVRAAAMVHAQAMAKHNTLSHGTPWQAQSTTANERLVALGLQPRFSAENIAFNFVLHYEPGRPFYTREENGRAVFSYAPDGAPLQPHTYASFAEAIVTQWMNSPGHRKNLLALEPEFLGVGCALARDAHGFDTIYAAQNFFAPLPNPLP